MLSAPQTVPGKKQGVDDLAWWYECRPDLATAGERLALRLMMMMMCSVDDLETARKKIARSLPAPTTWRAG